jgi:hypothetical protein
MSKTLVIVLSETRAHELTFDNFKKNVIDELNADLCLCIGVKSDYDYNNPFYNLAKYRFTYDEPDDFGDAFEYAYNIISQNKPKYDCLHNINALYGKIKYPQQSTENITYYGTNENNIINFDDFNDDEIIIHTKDFPNNLWKNQVYGVKNSDNNNLISEENIITYKKSLYWREFLKIKDQFLGGIKDMHNEHLGSAGILIFFRWFLLKNLIENNLLNKYDRFIITRSDFIYQLPHPKVEHMNDNYIWIPDCEHWGGYTDRHVVLSKTNIVQYLDILNNLVLKSNDYFMKMKNIKINNWNLERLIKFHLKQNNVLHLVREFPYIMYSIRNINGNSRWATGTYSKKLGYYIKYKTEYTKSTYYKNEFEKSKLTINEFYKTKCYTYTYISTAGFRDISKWLYCNRYEIIFEPEKINENDIVFLNLDLFDNFIKVLDNNKPKNKFILITFNSDKAFTEYHYDILKDLVVKIYSQNNTFYNNSILKTIPIGFRNWPIDTINTLIAINKINIEKTFLLYMNFMIQTNCNKRNECFYTFIKHNWVTKKKNIPTNLFYLDLKKSKYVLSPEGTGIDCHRIYESIYYDSIPILKTSLMDKFYEKLPVIIVNSWEEITFDFLSDNYNLYYNKLINWKKNNSLWLSPLFWLEY